MQQLEHFTPSEAKRLRTYNGTCARAYGLFKIHKEGNQLRPIIPCINYPTYELSKYFAGVLSNVVGKTSSHITNSKDVVSLCQGLFIPRTHTLFSFDVVSLFTNIPHIPSINDKIHSFIDNLSINIDKKITKIEHF